MSLAKTLAKIPQIEGKTRRGILVALEGPVLGGIVEKFLKIADELGDDYVMVSNDGRVQQWENPNRDYRLAVARLAKIQNQIHKHLEEGKVVVCVGHVLQALAAAHLNNCFGVHNMNGGSAFRTLYTQLRGIMIPDISFLYIPSLRVYVEKLIESGTIPDEDAFLHSQECKELKSLRFAGEYVDNATQLDSDGLRIEYDMLNYIVVKSTTECYEPIKYYTF